MTHFTPRAKRRGVSLIEVVACTVILAVMMVPMAAVMRSSRQAITQSQSSTSADQLRDGARWLRRTIATGTLAGTSRDTIAVTTAAGDYVKIGVQSGNLVMDDGRNQTLLIEGVRRIEFDPIKQARSPFLTVGLTIAIEAIDPTSGKTVSSKTVVSLAPQI